VLVRHDHGHAGEAADERAPHVGAELVGVENVNSLGAQEAGQARPGRDLYFSPPFERQEAHVRVFELFKRPQVRLPERVCPGNRKAAYTKGRLEPFGIEPRRQLQREALGAASKG
jgi:hypothetical protein